MRSIYLDYNATTPPDPAVREAMLPFLDEVWGNPSSVHHIGRKARAVLDDARDRAAGVLRCKPSEVIFTSGGTESINLAVLGTARLLKPKGRHLVCSSIEHQAVLRSNTVAFVVGQTDSMALLPALDIEGVCASSGSACSAGSLKPSHVAAALGLQKELCHALLRFSLGRNTAAEEIDFLQELLPSVIHRVQLPRNPV